MELSSVTELAPLAEVIRDVQLAATRAGVRIFVAGAVSRDLWMRHGHRIRTGRATEDLDLAVQCDGWEQFEALSARLVESGFERPDPRILHRFRHRQGTLVDLVPFGGIEREDRTIAWPPDEARVMNLVGFQEVLASARVFHLPGEVSVPVVSLPSLAALKLVAWQDRRLRAPGKDAADLYVILRNYTDAGNERRVFDDIPGLADREDFDFELAGAELLGRDLAKNSGPELLEALRRILEEESDAQGELRLANDMNRGAAEAARRLLFAVSRGLAAIDGPGGRG